MLAKNSTRFLASTPGVNRMTHRLPYPGVSYYGGMTMSIFDVMLSTNVRNTLAEPAARECEPERFGLQAATAKACVPQVQDYYQQRIGENA
jgi:hypothetical protein